VYTFVIFCRFSDIFNPRNLQRTALDPERFSKPLRILNEEISLLDANPVASGGYASVYVGQWKLPSQEPRKVMDGFIMFYCELDGAEKSLFKLL
jgi:hypothetical protein